MEFSDISYPSTFLGSILHENADERVELSDTRNRGQQDLCSFLREDPQ
jgi:hypothetical protein